MRSLRDRVGHLTVVTASQSFFARTAFVDFVPVRCEEYAELEPSDCGGPGFITIRAVTWGRYCTKRDELKAEGWTLLEG